MPPIDHLEDLSRFILDKRHWFKTDNPPVQSRVKYVVFLPNPNNGETSVFRTSDIEDELIWSIGDREVSAHREKPILGRVDIAVAVVISKDLEVISSEPPERHANITSWSDEKSNQKLIALELAAKARLYLR
ncbi:MAG: hypothetical protein ISR96_07035 [Nitrospira sp.]|nr:hypothetical protein [bacterium]MBL7049249.1 hypothetical protein [Nitrospira sp.]